MKIGRIIIRLSLLAVTFVTGASVDDYYAQKQFRENIKKVRLGMSEAEVVEILGKPIYRMIYHGDESLCFGAGSFHVEPSAACMISFKLSHDGRIIEAYPKEHSRPIGVNDGPRHRPLL